MDYKVEWPLLFMILGSAVGAILAVIFYAVTSKDMSLVFFPIFLFGGVIVGWFIDKVVYRNK